MAKEPDPIKKIRYNAQARLRGKPMTRAQLVNALAEEVGFSKADADQALEAITSIIVKEIAAGGAVTLPGIGKFHVRERSERMVRNPLTGEQIRKDPDRVVKVTIAKALKDAASD